MSHSNAYLGQTRSQLKNQIDPITVYKRSFLTFKDGKPFLMPLSGHIRMVGLNESAVCAGWQSYIISPFAFTDTLLDKIHSAPRKNCKCGFYAYKDKEGALDHYQLLNDSIPSYYRNTETFFTIVASGKIIEHEHGYRYGHQRVEEIIFRRCNMCDRTATRVFIPDSNFPETSIVVPTCGTHNLALPSEKVSFSTLEDRINSFMKSEYGEDYPAIKVKSHSSRIVPWQEDETMKAKIKRSVKNYFTT